MKKKGNKKMPTPRHKLIHNPIPTSLFLSSPQCISYSQFNVKMFFLCLMHSQQNKQNSEQRCRDGVMNEFVSWCRHLLVSFLFHALTSLHPPSFHRNDFSTCMNMDGEATSNSMDPPSLSPIVFRGKIMKTLVQILYKHGWGSHLK